MYKNKKISYIIKYSYSWKKRKQNCLFFFSKSNESSFPLLRYHFKHNMYIFNLIQKYHKYQLFPILTYVMLLVTKFFHQQLKLEKYGENEINL